MKVFQSVFFVILFAALPLMSQMSDDNVRIPLSLGIYGNVNMNMHSAGFNYITNDWKIIDFSQNKNYFSGSAGLILDVPLSDIFVLTGRIGYNGAGAIIDGSGVTPDANTYKLDATLGYFEITPGVQFHNLLPLKPLYFLAGLEFGIPLSPKYTLNRQNPVTAIESGVTLPDAKTRIALALGLGYVIKVSEKVNMQPEFSVRIPFSKVSNYNNFISWDVPQLRLGVSLNFGLTSENKKVAEVEKSTYLKIGEVNVSYLGSDGKLHKVDRVRLEDVQYTEQYPIVPYIFYTENQAVPDKKEQILLPGTQAGEFNEKMIDPDALIVNEHLMDIIGSRMKANPNSDITITGTIDGVDEKQGSKLSQSRADWAKNYLVDNWKINPERINVHAIGQPEKPSTSKVEDGIAENRRTEFASSNNSLLAPVYLNKESERIADPSMLEFTTNVKSSDPITSWTLEISQSGKDLRTYEGTGTIKPIMWNIAPNELESRQLPIDYLLTVKNAAGNTESTTGQIPVDYFSFTRKKTENMPDKVVSKYSLILFDFDKFDITPPDMEIINKFIIPDIKYNSTVKIYGFTDRIGSDDYNKTLAGNRANAVMTLLQGKIGTAKYEMHAVGKDFAIFDNDLPLGRQLSRTVQITIETPK
jgi:outer membrane protein OmpA-like peptidoglycan-associated protein